MMNWILLVMAAVAAVVVAMIVGGLLSPRVRVAVESRRCADAPATVFRVLREADGPPRWCPDLPTMVVEVEQPPERIVLALRDDDGAPLGSWDVRVAAADDGAVATITETVVVPNPILRFLRTFGGQGERPQRFLAAAAEELRRRPSDDNT